jgi:hypothetical protein
MHRKRFLLTSIAIFIALVVGTVLGNSLFARPAQAQAPRTAPKSYGTLKGAVGNHLIFEDSTGTIRIVNIQDQLNTYTAVQEFRRN